MSHITDTSEAAPSLGEADVPLNRPNYKLVLVEWVDSYTDTKTWHRLDGEINDPAICISVGYLVGDKEKVKVIYPHIALEDKVSDECGKGAIIIPTISIVGIKILSEK
jgi:hypothetical protein